MIEEAISRLPPPSTRHGSPQQQEQEQEQDQEQILGLFDLRGFKMPENADFQFAFFLIEAFFELYPRRVGQVLFVDAPWVFLPAWEVVKPLMRKYAALVQFVSVKEAREGYFEPGSCPSELS